MMATAPGGQRPRAPRAVSWHTAGLFRSLARAATGMAAIAWSAARPAAGAGDARGRITEVDAFGTNPGALRMLVFEPPRRPRAGAPLIVVLHGCRQNAASFATDAGWLDVAKRLGIPLVMPEQVMANNRSRCFNWYRPDDVSRTRGEAMSIRQMIRTAVTRFGCDRRRVFIVGLSAGGAMTAAMLAAYPAVFAAGAVVAGMPVGAASTSPMALIRMFRADPHRTRAGLAAAVRARAPSRGRQPWPRLSIWQGGRDRTVDPANAEVLAAQWSALHGFDEAPSADTAPLPGTRRRQWGRDARPAVELWTIPALAHGFPIDAGRDGVGEVGPWVLDAGIAAARHITAFWGLEPVGRA